jgi:hypothetical protein
VREISGQTLAIYQECLQRPLSTPAALRALVHAIGDACLALLDRWHQSSQAHRHEIQAACLYFADADDGTDDFATIGGFDDDARVLNHVCKKIGRRDLLISVGPSR